MPEQATGFRERGAGQDLTTGKTEENEGEMHYLVLALMRKQFLAMKVQHL